MRTPYELRQRITFAKYLLPVLLLLPLPLNWLTQTLRFGDLFIVICGVYSAAIVFAAIQYVDHQLTTYESAMLRNNADEHRLAGVMRSAADAILLLDNQGRIQTWNVSATRMFGYESIKASGRPFAMLLGAGPAANVESQWLINAVLCDGNVQRHETTVHDINGRYFNVDLTAARIEADGENATGISIILRNIDERKRYETEIARKHTRLTQQSARHAAELSEKVAQLAQANKELQQIDQTRSEFVSLVSHQIRSPLTNMVGAVQRMQANCLVATPTCNRMFAIFEQQVDRLERLVQDVLNIVRIEQDGAFLQQEPVSIVPVVRQAIQQIETRTGPRDIQFAEKPGLPLVYADRDRLVEVLANLLDNADKYTTGDGPIVVDIRADQSEVTVTVRDSGPGLRPTDLERVFEKFYRADSSDSQTTYGYGLGLYLCRRLIEAQNGYIWAENHPDGGAVFSFALPVWEG